jgi:hypothetical protein
VASILGAVALVRRGALLWLSVVVAIGVVTTLAGAGNA